MRYVKGVHNRHNYKPLRELEKVILHRNLFFSFQHSSCTYHLCVIRCLGVNDAITQMEAAIETAEPRGPSEADLDFTKPR
jgi:hypothetical protein